MEEAGIRYHAIVLPKNLFAVDLESNLPIKPQIKSRIF